MSSQKPNSDERALIAGHGEIGALIRAMAKESHPSLGTAERWPESLRATLRLMLASRYAMWLGWGPDLTFFYNDAYREQTLGTKHPWALGKPASEVWAEIWHTIGPRVARVLETGEATWDEGLLLFLERSGFPEETYHTFSYSPAPGDDGETVGLFCVVIEETDRVIGARRLALLRDLAALLGATTALSDVLRALEQCLSGGLDFPFSLTYLVDGPDAVLRRAARTDIDASHPAAALEVSLKETGGWWPLAEVLQKGEPRVVPLREGAAWPATAWGKAPSHAIIVPIAQPGHDRPTGVFIAALSPYRPIDDAVKSHAGLLVGQLAAGISNARAYEAEKKRAEGLAEIDRAKTTFFSNVSHEFRTPLTLMLGPLEEALTSPARSLSGDNLELSHRNAVRLLRLVNALLDFSRIEAGRVQASYVQTDISVLTSELASMFRSAIERGGLRLTLDMQAIEAPVFVDREMWEKIVLNLISNALKFTFEGEIAVGIVSEGGNVRLTVRDTGTGVPAAEVPHLFERFHRVEGAKARNHEGSGIGLALVSELVKLHGGSISVESVEGKGTTFDVRIPTGSDHLSPRRIVTTTSSATGAVTAAPFVEEALRWLPEAVGADVANEEISPAEDADGSPTRRRIVLADDNADMREYVARLLRTHWRVEAVADGKEALAAIRRDPPALVLSDVMMPNLDGFGLVRALREDPATRTVPIILLSARAGEEATTEGLQSGANDYLIKPFTARELIARVSSQLTIAELREQSERAREAQRRVMETIFEHAPAAIAMLRGPELVIEFANPRIIELWQRTSADEVVGKPLFDALPELIGQGFDVLFRNVMETGEPFFGNELPATFQRDGRDLTLFFNFAYVPTTNEEGVVDGASVFAFDVTPQVNARARAELGSHVGRALVTSDALTEQLHRSCEAIMKMGASLARIWVYDHGHAHFQLRASAGAYASTLEDGGFGPLGPQTLERIGRERTPLIVSDVRNDPRIADQDWVIREEVVCCVAYPLMVGERLMGFVAMFATRELPEEILTALSSVADPIALGIDRDASERFRELFIGMLGHDLRNPLNAVMMANHVLQPNATDAQKKTLRRIDNSARRMERMITQVLDFTRARSGGGIPIVRAPLDLRAICDLAIEELVAAHPDRTITLNVDGDAQGAWDGDRMAQVFSNLISNAVAYGRPDAPVVVRLDATAPIVKVSVENEGPVIPSEILPRLFDPFRRAVHAKTAGTQGLGLGLFITHQIVSAHGGSISVHSSEERGTVFSVLIPKEGALG